MADFHADHDFETASTTSTAVSQVETLMDRFTATGGPMPKYEKPSAWVNAGFCAIQVPQHPPFRFTDDSIISVMIRLQECSPATEPQHKPNGFTGAAKKLRQWALGTESPSSRMKLVRMPRRDYLKHFAQKANKENKGTVSQRRWTEEELDAEFGIYQDVEPLKWVMRQSAGRTYMEEERIIL